MIQPVQKFRLFLFHFLRRSAFLLGLNGIVGVFIIALIFGGSLETAQASVTVTGTTGGSSISADTTGGIYTSLTGPVISEGATADIGRNGNLPGTIILNVPSGFIFDPGGTAPTVLVTRTAGSGSNSNNINKVASGSSLAITSRTTTQITFTVLASTQNNVTNSLTWQNMRVRPTAGTPLASGNISESGTLSIVGVTGSTNFGTLTEVVGAKSQLVITTQPSSSATTATDFGTNPVIAVQDQFGNTVTSDGATTITRSAVLSTQSCGGTAGSGILTSTPASGAVVSSGVMTYTAMQYSTAESIKICFSSSGITAALSNVIIVTISPPPPPPPPSPPPPPPPPPPPSTGVGGGVSPTRVFFSGQAFPGSTVETLRKGTLDATYSNVPATNEVMNDDGTFSVEFLNLLQGEYVFALRARDKDGRETGLLPFVTNLLSSNELIVTDILFSPTVGFEKLIVTKGNEIGVKGYAAASAKVEYQLDNLSLKSVEATASGAYLFKIPTTDLNLGDHYLRVRQVLALGRISDYSYAKTFRISLLAFPKADFNGDGAVTIIDWSIFLFRWAASDPALRAKIDMDGNGIVDIADFSIFLKAMKL